jgi:hypothetical protein
MSGVDYQLQPFEKAANDLNFPDLLAQVNAQLETSLHFADSYQSLQTGRSSRSMAT